MGKEEWGRGELGGEGEATVDEWVRGPKGGEGMIEGRAREGLPIFFFLLFIFFFLLIPIFLSFFRVMLHAGEYLVRAQDCDAPVKFWKLFRALFVVFPFWLMNHRGRRESWKP